jgi:hypothetical protein
MLLPALPGIVVVSALVADAALDRLRLAWRAVLGAAPLSSVRPSLR